MALEIMRDARVRSVAWQDLTALSRWEIIKELLLPAPWLIASWLFAAHGWLLPALLVSFMFFLAGLRLVHNAYHYAVGVPRWLTEGIMAVLSLLMLGSMHAIQFHHLRHHKHCLDEEDVEAMSARMTWLGALLMGPWFPVVLHWKALQMAARKQRRWIVLELLMNVVWITTVFFLLDLGWLRYHVVVMALGQCLTAFFAVWTVHHDCDRSYLIARTLRRGWLNLLALNMFFHVEHHLFPKVPTCHLPCLAQRLDVVAPELKMKQVI
jgi:fatty acid desaturase